MKRLGFPGRIDHLSVIEISRGSSILLGIVVTIVFFFGCETTRNDQADRNTVIRPSDKGSEVHGEVGVMYGNNLGR